jgi:hypothetical protein
MIGTRDGGMNAFWRVPERIRLQFTRTSIAGRLPVNGVGEAVVAPSE